MAKFREFLERDNYFAAQASIHSLVVSKRDGKIGITVPGINKRIQKEDVKGFNIARRANWHWWYDLDLIYLDGGEEKTLPLGTVPGIKADSAMNWARKVNDFYSGSNHPTS
ncbi:hypothetical protein CMI41_00155 [Candidatus Pacearchaeota archaeon]|nr:hypothetical protein [Candidatus Pacearchaeota archaeon]